ncbi:MAG: hypothetical protein ABSG92_00755 [Conexivisphaerales archaeon]
MSPFTATMAFGRSRGEPWIYSALVIVPAVAKVVQAGEGSSDGRGKGKSS